MPIVNINFQPNLEYFFNDSLNNECVVNESSIYGEKCLWLGLKSSSPYVILNGEKVKFDISLKETKNALGIVNSNTLGIDVTGLNRLLIDDRMHLSITNLQEILVHINKYLTDVSFEKYVFKDRYEKVCSIEVVDNLIRMGCVEPNPRMLMHGWVEVNFSDNIKFDTYINLDKHTSLTIATLISSFIDGE